MSALAWTCPACKETVPFDKGLAVAAILAHADEKGCGPVCRICKGSGADPMSDNVNWLPCGVCRGTGKASAK